MQIRDSGAILLILLQVLAYPAFCIQWALLMTFGEQRVSVTARRRLPFAAIHKVGKTDESEARFEERLHGHPASSGDQER